MRLATPRATDFGSTENAALMQPSRSRLSPTAARFELDDAVSLRVTPAMEVGRITISIRDFLQHTAGSVIELGRETVEAFDIPVNCTVLAHGKTMMVKEQCGVRLADVIRLAERIRPRGQ